MHKPAVSEARLGYAGRGESEPGTGDKSLLERDGDGDNGRHGPAITEFDCYLRNHVVPRRVGRSTSAPGWHAAGP